MTIDLPPNDSLLFVEEQYEAAAWKSTIDSLALLHTDITSDETPPKLPHIVKELAAIAYSGAGEILPFIEEAPVSYRSHLMQIGLLNKDTITPTDGLVLMHHIHHADDDSVMREIIQLTNFDRFTKDIAELALYNHRLLRQAIAENNSTIECLKMIQRDTSFYLGEWDYMRIREKSEID